MVDVGRKLGILGRQLVLRAYGATFLIGATPRTARAWNALAPFSWIGTTALFSVSAVGSSRFALRGFSKIRADEAWM